MQRFAPGSCLNFRGELAHICSLDIRENASQEKSFACNKHGLCRYYFRGCRYAFVCFLMDRAHVLDMELKRARNCPWSLVDATFSQGSLISAAPIAFERCYAIYWPLKHRTMSFKAYYIIIFIIWTLAFLLSAVFNIALFLISSKAAAFCWMSFSLPSLFIICACSIGIWKKFQLRNISSQQQNRAFLNKRLTLTLLLVSTISVLSWLPLLIANCLIYILKINIPKVDLFYYIIILLNFSNSLVNPVVYSLRVLEFRQTLGICIIRRRKLMNRNERNKGRGNMGLAPNPAIRPSTQPNDQNRLQRDFELETIVTKL